MNDPSGETRVTAIARAIADKAENSLATAHEAISLLRAEVDRLEAELQREREVREAASNEAARLATELNVVSAELTATRDASAHLGTENADLRASVQPLLQIRENLREEVEQLTSLRQQDADAGRDLRLQILELHHDLRATDLPSLILRVALNLTGAEAGLLTQADGDGITASVGLDDLPEPVREAIYRYTRQAAASNDAVVENDPDKLPDGLALVNLAALPFSVKSAHQGVILVANKRSGPFTDSDTELLLAIGQHAGLALENSRLHCALTESYASTVAALADAIEAKDAYTRGHCGAVAEVAVAVAVRLGVDSEKLDEIRYAALLHDVGKIGVPDGILLKPGKLTIEEFAVIQKHALIGRDLVVRIPALAGIAEIILRHHEKWDGSGYPGGLKGEEIPLAARIVGAVDALDAMTTPRPYRDPWPVTEALSEINRCSGSHFDPQIVCVLTEVAMERISV